jgi:hypothetical protein
MGGHGSGTVHSNGLLASVLTLKVATLTRLEYRIKIWAVAIYSLLRVSRCVEDIHAIVIENAFKCLMYTAEGSSSNVEYRNSK